VRRRPDIPAWPGPFLIDQTEEGRSLHGFSAAEVIWDFLKQHQHPIDNTMAGGS